jgi:hypothetical protein
MICAGKWRLEMEMEMEMEIGDLEMEMEMEGPRRHERSELRKPKWKQLFSM